VYVTDGNGRVQTGGGPIETIHPGDVVHTPPQERHWHGAAEQHHMTHESITQGSPTFGPHGTDAEYRRS
jgi:quercetin dioxygenase-like cupin family protein